MEGLLLYKNGTVCDDNFDINSAEAICGLFGYSGRFSWSSGSKWGIQNKYDINLDNVQCSSGDWSSCTYTTNNSCNHSEDIFLACSGKLHFKYYFSLPTPFCIELKLKARKGIAKRQELPIEGWFENAYTY